MQRKSLPRFAVVALLGGATGIGFAPVFVRLSEVGPSATAFYRLLFALPWLWLATLIHSSSKRASASQLSARVNGSWRLCGLAGLLFAADLAFWHWSIQLTSVANSTLLTNCAPFFVMWGARFLFSERITGWLILGMAVACIGAALLVGASFHLAHHFVGDLLGLITAVFYGGYLLTVKQLRRSSSSVSILAWSGLVSCALLLVAALLSHESVRIRTARGWAILLALALFSHIGGQGLIAYALAHLPAGFSSVALLFQPVVAALLAWILLSEPLSGLQILGGLAVLTGIAIASRTGRLEGETTKRKTAITGK
jgi:drug/metabolite transporter (DMT)-like permease